MQMIIKPSVCNGKVKIPPSKSMAHRAIISACLAQGTSLIKNISYSKDILATINAMEKLGAKIEKCEDSLKITGIGSIEKISDTSIYCNESGSTLRFLIPIFSLTNQKITFTGEKSLMCRPQNIYRNIFGEAFNQDEDKITIEKSLKAQKYVVDGNVSSQFITGLLFALSMLKDNSTIEIKPPFESRSYVNLTIKAMADFGVKVCFIGDNEIKIVGGQKYLARDYTVEGDYSQMAFFAVLGAINNDLECVGLDKNSVQGDKAIIDILRKSNVQIAEAAEGYLIKKSDIVASEIDLSDCPDLGPILMILALFAKGETVIKNAQRLRVKESDRISAMEQELLKIGADIKTTNDTITIIGKKNYCYCCNSNAQIFAHNDHRVAMSMAVMATKCENEIIINNAECVDKSYPNFFDDLKAIKIDCQEVEG